MSYFKTTNIAASDSASLDAFSRWRVSNPEDLFHSTFQYDLSPLLYEQIVTGTGSISHDAVNADSDLAVTAGGVGSAAMQSYQYVMYQPGKSQMVFITFTFGQNSLDLTRRIGLFDSQNGIFLEQTGIGTINLVKRSSSSSTNVVVAKANWNIDPMDGSGPSGLTLDLTKSQILVIDAQWLGVGRVRVGFDINGVLYYVHEFLHANIVTHVYMTTLSLPIRAEITTTSAQDATMTFICACVASEGGSDLESALVFAQSVTGVACGSGTRTHAISIRPTSTFNSIANRATYKLDTVEVLVTGNSPILWELCFGSAITGTTAFNAVNATYSGMEYNTAGTLSGNPSIVIYSGVAAGTSQSKSSISKEISTRYPITLNAAGVARSLGTVTVLLQGVGGSSVGSVTLNWKEIR